MAVASASTQSKVPSELLCSKLREELSEECKGTAFEVVDVYKDEITELVVTEIDVSALVSTATQILFDVYAFTIGEFPLYIDNERMEIVTLEPGRWGYTNEHGATFARGERTVKVQDERMLRGLTFVGWHCEHPIREGAVYTCPYEAAFPLSTRLTELTATQSAGYTRQADPLNILGRPKGVIAKAGDDDFPAALVPGPAMDEIHRGDERAKLEQENKDRTEKVRQMAEHSKVESDRQAAAISASLDDAVKDREEAGKELPFLGVAVPLNKPLGTTNVLLLPDDIVASPAATVTVSADLRRTIGEVREELCVQFDLPPTVMSANSESKVKMDPKEEKEALAFGQKKPLECIARVLETVFAYRNDVEGDPLARLIGSRVVRTEKTEDCSDDDDETALPYLSTVLSPVKSSIRVVANIPSQVSVEDMTTAYELGFVSEAATIEVMRTEYNIPRKYFVPAAEIKRKRAEREQLELDDAREDIALKKQKKQNGLASKK